MVGQLVRIPIDAAEQRDRVSRVRRDDLLATAKSGLKNAGVSAYRFRALLFLSPPAVRNGVPLALLAYAIYAWGDGLIKGLGGTLTVFEIGFFNILFSGLFLLLVKPGGEDWRIFGGWLTRSGSMPAPRSAWPPAH